MTEKNKSKRSFELKLEAEKAFFEDSRSFQNLHFCPLIEGECNPGCVCYSSPRIRTIKTHGKDDYFLIDEGYCNNFMFSGRE